MRVETGPPVYVSCSCLRRHPVLWQRGQKAGGFGGRLWISLVKAVESGAKPGTQNFGTLLQSLSLGPLGIPLGLCKGTWEPFH